MVQVIGVVDWEVVVDLCGFLLVVVEIGIVVFQLVKDWVEVVECFLQGDDIWFGCIDQVYQVFCCMCGFLQIMIENVNVVFVLCVWDVVFIYGDCCQQGDVDGCCGSQCKLLGQQCDDQQ